MDLAMITSVCLSNIENVRLYFTYSHEKNMYRFEMLVEKGNVKLK